MLIFWYEIWLLLREVLFFAAHRFLNENYTQNVDENYIQLKSCVGMGDFLVLSVGRWDTGDLPFIGQCDFLAGLDATWTHQIHVISAKDKI